MRWYAVMTKCRKEDYAANNLRRQNFVVFFPHYKEWTRPKKVKPRLLKKPYLPRYIFVGMGSEGNQSIFTINNTYGVSTVVYCGMSVLPVSQVVVDEIKHRADDFGEIPLSTQEKKEFEGRSGDIIRFRNTSPLFGFLAQIKRVDKGGTLVVELDKMLGSHRNVMVKNSDVGAVVYRKTAPATNGGGA